MPGIFIAVAIYMQLRICQVTAKLNQNLTVYWSFWRRLSAGSRPLNVPGTKARRVWLDKAADFRHTMESKANVSAMKCSKHVQDAIGVCVYCGRAVCPECRSESADPRLLCSETCAAGRERQDRAMQMILQRSEQSLHASALYCYLCGILSLLAALLAWFLLPLPFLVYFCIGCGVVLMVSGFWYGRAAKKQAAG
jgi:hypothetical protein